MEIEYIVQTESGSLYHITYRKHFFEHGGRFTCRQLFGKEEALLKDDVRVLGFEGPGGGIGRDLDLQHLRLGVKIDLPGPTSHSGGLSRIVTTPIVKIYQRIN